MALDMKQMADFADFLTMYGIAKEMKTDMKAEVDDEFGHDYALTGTKSRDAFIEGVKVATLTWVPGTAPSEDLEVVVDDPDSLFEWAMEHDMLVPDMEKVQLHFEATGEVADGCSTIRRLTRGRRGYVKVTPTDERKAYIEGRVRGFLGEGE